MLIDAKFVRVSGAAVSLEKESNLPEKQRGGRPTFAHLKFTRDHNSGYKKTS